MNGALFSLILVLAAGQQIQPIPPSEDGISLGTWGGNYTLDVFFDHLCEYSANAYPGLYQYWSQNQGWLRMVIHIYPLPYHYYSYTVSRAGRFIQLNYPDNFTDFLSWMFQHQSKYLDAAQTWNEALLYSYLATDTQTATGVPYSQTIQALNDKTYDYNLRVSWKYATSKGITGTPQYMVNGVWAPEASSCSTAQDWQNFFSSLS